MSPSINSSDESDLDGKEGKETTLEDNKPIPSTTVEIRDLKEVSMDDNKSDGNYIYIIWHCYKSDF